MAMVACAICFQGERAAATPEELRVCAECVAGMQRQEIPEGVANDLALVGFLRAWFAQIRAYWRGNKGG